MIVYRRPMLDRLKALRNRPFLVALLVGIAAQLLFTVHLDQPSRIMFDEVHYVPAAQALLDLTAPRNIEHPLVGKELIAGSIAVLGDTRSAGAARPRSLVRPPCSESLPYSGC